MSSLHVDVLIVGAGLSGIGAGYYLQSKCPSLTYAILESREAIGGTWDLFRYPGIRSDSDMHTLGYAFRPWTDAKAIADGPSILRYIEETAQSYGIDRKIRFRHRVVRAAWSTHDARWTLDVEVGEARELVRYSANFLYMCSGYYDYTAGYTPEFPGAERFRGRIVHPQAWSADVDYKEKRVVVIGSGATAVTLVPELAKSAAHVTMLQRSPTYIVTSPDEDVIAKMLRRVLPAKAAYAVTRWKNVLRSMLFYELSRRKPELMKKIFLDGVRTALGPDYDVDTHFTPSYNPWDQRVCLAPNGDLFTSLSEGRASVVTDRITSFTERGIQLESGRELEADLIVTATGLTLTVLGHVTFTIDGAPVDFAETVAYKGMMYSDVPNLAAAFGYTNASWTLKCDLTSQYVCRLLTHMQQTGTRQCTARVSDPAMEFDRFVDLASGYIMRSVDLFPKQGKKTPWRTYQNYLRDLLALRYGGLEDGYMEFSNPKPATRAPREVAPKVASPEAAAP